MANRLKEDEKSEKIIRGLLKLPANRKCANCNNLGPQYVCTTFWTFICTNCSGVHREFTHRVKSISMAKFSMLEVNALQEGGNERAKEIYFKVWDPQRHSVPDSSNIERLRDFIKHVYVDRRYTGERNNDSTPSKGVQYGYASPIRDRSNYKRSPARFEVVDDRLRDGKCGKRIQFQRFQGRNSPDVLPKTEGRSPDHQKNVSTSSLPVIRPVTDILGDNIPELHIGDLPKSDGTRAPENSLQPQKNASSSSLKSGDEDSVEAKRENLGSLIDFSAEPEPSVAVALQQSVHPQTAIATATSGDCVPSQQEAPQAAASANSLESLLAQLSVPGLPPAGSLSDLLIAGVHPLPIGQLPAMQQLEPSLVVDSDCQSTNLASSTVVADQMISAPLLGASSIVVSESSVEPNMPDSSMAFSIQQVQVATIAPETSAGVFSQFPAEAKPSGRQELPENLFTAICPPATASGQGWQRGPHPGMQYPSGVAMAIPHHSSKSTNPFDVVNETLQSQASTFPAMAALQGALPSSTGSPALLQASSFEAPSQRGEPLRQPSYLQDSYIMHQGPTENLQHAHGNRLPTIYQGLGGNGNEVGSAFGNSGLDLHSAIRYSQTGTPDSFAAMGGNPFG